MQTLQINAFISRIPLWIRVAVVGLGVALSAGTAAPVQAQSTDAGPGQVQVMDVLRGDKLPAGLSQEEWAEVPAFHGEVRVKIKARSWLRISPARYGYGCRACRCFSTVLAVQKGRHIAFDLAKVNDPTVGLCRAMSRVTGGAIVGPLDPGTWVLTGVKRGEVEVQVGPE